MIIEGCKPPPKEQNALRAQARRRVSTACSSCRFKKVKCTEKFRPCTRCVATTAEASCWDEADLRYSQSLSGKYFGNKAITSDYDRFAIFVPPIFVNFEDLVTQKSTRNMDSSSISTTQLQSNRSHDTSRPVASGTCKHFPQLERELRSAEAAYQRSSEAVASDPDRSTMPVPERCASFEGVKSLTPQLPWSNDNTQHPSQRPLSAVTRIPPPPPPPHCPAGQEATRTEQPDRGAAAAPEWLLGPASAPLAGDQDDPFRADVWP